MNCSVKFFDPTLSVCAAAAPQARQSASTMTALRASDLMSYPHERRRKSTGAPRALHGASGQGGAKGGGHAIGLPTPRSRSRHVTRSTGAAVKKPGKQD